MVIERVGSLFEKKLINDPSYAEKMRNPFMKKLIQRYSDKYKLLKLKRILRYAYENSPFYNKLFKEAGVKPSDVKSFKDMEKIPFTNPKDLEENPTQFFCVPESKFTRLYTTAGTTGKPKRIYFTKKDVERMISAEASGLHLIYGINADDIIQIMFSIGFEQEIWGSIYYCEMGAERLGAMPIVSGQRPPEKEIELMKAYKPTILNSTPSYINRVTREMMDSFNLDELGIRMMILGAEPLPESLRKRLEGIWNADVRDAYGLVEIGMAFAGECEEKNGYHLDDGQIFAEVVDPNDGEKMEDGVGELVFTTIDREGMPLIRYKSHDLGSIMDEECECGLPLQRIGKIMGRTDGMVIIGSGDNAFAEMFDRALFALPDVVDYRMIIDEKNGKDCLTAEVETKNGRIKEKIFNALIQLPILRDGLMKKTIELKVKLLKPGSFDRKLKMKRIIDRRNLYE